MLVFLNWDRLINDEIWGTICISVPPLQILGGRVHPPPVIYAHVHHEAPHIVRGTWCPPHHTPDITVCPHSSHNGAHCVYAKVNSVFTGVYVHTQLRRSTSRGGVSSLQTLHRDKLRTLPCDHRRLLSRSCVRMLSRSQISPRGT